MKHEEPKGIKKHKGIQRNLMEENFDARLAWWLILRMTRPVLWLHPITLISCQFHGVAHLEMRNHTVLHELHFVATETTQEPNCIHLKTIKLKKFGELEKNKKSPQYWDSFLCNPLTRCRDHC